MLMLNSACGILLSAPPTNAADENHNESNAVKLYGRIEQLSGQEGATLPLKLVPQTPLLDKSLSSTAPLSGKLARSFPLDYLGQWSGEMTISTFACDEAFYRFDPVEAKKQEQLLAPGTKGTCSVTFFVNGEKKIDMLTTDVAFNGVLDNGSPTIYNLHLGNLQAGKGVTGNEITSALLKNSLTELKENVWEQESVTTDRDRNPKSGKIKTDYTENVLRLTRVDHNHLYLQAATVSYGKHGKFQNKVLLYGTLTKVLN